MTKKDIRREYRQETGFYPAKDEYSLGGNLKTYDGDDLIEYIDWLEEKLTQSKPTITSNKNILIT